MQVRFGEFRIDSATRQLFRADTEAHLTPKAFELLQALLADRPRALSKTEITERLWPDTFVSEANLSVLIAEIRSAIADPPRNPRFIRTVHRFGYAFCGAATDIAASPAGSNPDGAKYWLVSASRRLSIADADTVIGRDPAQPIWFDVPGVSRQHARIVIADGMAAIEDLGSKNGTYVRGERITHRVSLQHGDEIRLGPIRLTFMARTPETTRTEVISDAEAPASSKRP